MEIVSWGTITGFMQKLHQKMTNRTAKRKKRYFQQTFLREGDGKFL